MWKRSSVCSTAINLKDSIRGGCKSDDMRCAKTVKEKKSLGIMY